MKGQPIASQKMQAYLESCDRGNAAHRPVLISGPSGVGKSHISKEFENQLELIGYEVHRFDDSGVIRTVADFYSQVKPLLECGRKIAILFDECQNLIGRRPDGISGIVSQQMRGLVYPHGDLSEVKQWVSISLKQDEIISVNFKNVLLIFMTNEPDKLETTQSLKNGDYPFRRRMYSIELEKYPEDLIPEIIRDMTDAMGLKINDCCRKIIGRYHRGTMEALSVVLSMHKMKFPDERLITKARLLEAAKMTNFLPRGLIKQEARLLHLLSQNGGSFAYNLIGSRLNCDNKAVQSAVSYLSDQRTDGSHTPFVRPVGQKIAITENGKAYLKTVQAEGFSII